jgi:uncharacterized membrane protein YbhN (UPF0104 family)
MPALPRHRLIAALKWLVAALVLFFVVRSFQSARDSIASSGALSLDQLHPGWMAVSGITYVLAMLPMGAYWIYLLRVLGQPVTWYRGMTAYYVGHLGKYVPGKAMVVVLRAGLLRTDKGSSAVAAISVFIETFTMMAAGAGLATVLIAWQFSEHRMLLGMGVFLLFAASIPTWPPLVRWLLRRVRAASLTTEVEQQLANYTWRVMLVGWLLELSGWSFMGVSLWAILRAIPLETTLEGVFSLWPRLTASVSLSMVAGFLSLLPGGIGVRELVLDQLLKQPFGPVIAPLSAVLLRLIWLLTELVVSSILYLGLRFSRS